MQKISSARLALPTALFTLALLAWDASGLDLPLAHLVGGADGFPLQHNWWLTRVLHDGARRAAWALAFGLCLAAWWPPGPLSQLGLGRRLQLAATPLAAVSMVSLLKTFSATSCPWGLAEFGGVAHHSMHWAQLLQPDGGSGHCFPAGHATSGFAFIGAYFVFRGHAPATARRWLVLSMLVGVALGAAQQLRGAHFMSHTLWSAWICWCTAWALDSAWDWAGKRQLLAARKAAS